MLLIFIELWQNKTMADQTVLQRLKIIFNCHNFIKTVVILIPSVLSMSLLIVWSILFILNPEVLSFVSVEKMIEVCLVLSLAQ
jgi:hypothetical protein